MFDEIKLSLIVALLIFSGMLLGGTLIRIISIYLDKSYKYLYIFCGSLLAGLFVFELLPEVFRQFQLIGIITGISIGIFIMMTMEVLLHKSHHLHAVDQDTLFLLIVALTIHSVPTGVTFGLGLQASQMINYSLLGIFVLHHIPEGMIIMASIPNGVANYRLFTTFCLILSIVMGINIFLGLNMQIDSMKWNTVMMGMTIGTLGYVTFYELLWKKSKNLPKGKVALIVVLGIAGIHFFLRYIPFHF